MPHTSKTAANRAARNLMRAGYCVCMWRERSTRSGYIYYVNVVRDTESNYAR